MHYAVVIKQAEGDYSANAPDLLSYFATVASIQEIEKNIRETIELHLESLREDRLPTPVSSTDVEYCELVA
jgi:predicted RNase H-like HicB family nuclease